MTIHRLVNAGANLPIAVQNYTLLLYPNQVNIKQQSLVNHSLVAKDKRQSTLPLQQHTHGKQAHNTQPEPLKLVAEPTRLLAMSLPTLGASIC